MQLTFLGKSYYYEPQIIDTPKSEFSGRFLGSTYTMRRSVTAKTTSQSNRKYRGVAY